MNKNPVYLLIHSPLVGTLTWTMVAEELRQKGLDVIVPALVDVPDAGKPFWRQHAESVLHALVNVPKDTTLILVGHSGAGPLLPVIRQSIPNPVHAYVFVDAGIARDGATRLDLMKSEDPEWARQFQEELTRGERFPTWSSDDLREIIPDQNIRQQLVAELHPRGLDFFTEPIPVSEGWPDAACIYIQFSTPYETSAVQAREAGWSTYLLEAGHFHMLVDSKTVTDLIVNAVRRVPRTDL